MTEKTGDSSQARRPSCRGWSALGTMLVRGGRSLRLPREGAFVNAPVARGSTVLFPSLEAMDRQGRKSHEHELVYGAMGNPVQHELERLLAEIEGGTHTQVVGSGLAACTMALMSFLAQGDHLLLPDSVYSPTRRFAETFLKRMGVETEYYAPLSSREELRAKLRPQTKILFAESPGSHTFEVQDVPMLAELAHEAGARLLLDNTWGIGVFQPFAHGVDVSIQALTKYPSGHSDVIAGSITVQRDEDWRLVRDTAIQLGLCASPDECWLTLRGLRTMGVRLEHQSRSALDLAHWLKGRPEVARVLHPALKDCPGHVYWKRDFTGASGLFGVELRGDIVLSAMEKMIDSLELFGIGASWGGYESLVLPTTGRVTRVAGNGAPQTPSFRLQIGLEAVEDLRADLDQAFRHLS